MTTLNKIDRIPDELLSAEPTDLLRILTGPTLLHLTGRRPETLFVTALQHGNEDVGLRAVQKLLKKYNDRALPKSLCIFFSNVAAAQVNTRRLANQPDYNRVWPGGDGPHCAERTMMQEVVAEVSKMPLFASVDLHNNAGLNPHYACINKLDNVFLQLAVLFGRTVVYFTQPRGVQSMALATLCPAVTLECGQSGNPNGAQHAFEYLDACMNLDHISDRPVAAQDIDLFHTTAIVKVPPQATLGIGNEDGDIVLANNLEFFNFRELSPGTVFGFRKSKQPFSLIALDDAGFDRANDYFAIEQDEIRLKRAVMPSMLTVNITAIRQDCLCYFMERYTRP